MPLTTITFLPTLCLSLDATRPFTPIPPVTTAVGLCHPPRPPRFPCHNRPHPSPLLFPPSLSPIALTRASHDLGAAAAGRWLWRWAPGTLAHSPLDVPDTIPAPSTKCMVTSEMKPPLQLATAGRRTPPSSSSSPPCALDHLNCTNPLPN